MAIDEWGNQTPDFGTGFKSMVFDQSYGGEGVWGDSRPAHQGRGWYDQGKEADPSGYNQYVASNKAKYYSPYSQAQRMASNTSNMLTGLLTDPSKIQQTAGYQFAVDQGNQAINRSAAAKGQLNSGGVLAELQKYGQGMASQEYGNQVNQLSGLMKGSQDFLVGANQNPYTYGALNPSSNSTFNPYSRANPNSSSYTSFA